MVKFTSEQKSIERMDNMVLEEKKVKNICNFYVSEYHLEIMLLPYISKKIDNEENITIITEIDLESTLNVVIERINLEKDKKEMEDTVQQWKKEDTKLCPFCAEEIKKAAMVCKHCGRDIPPNNIY